MFNHCLLQTQTSNSLKCISLLNCFKNGAILTKIAFELKCFKMHLMLKKTEVEVETTMIALLPLVAAQHLLS